MIRRSLSLVLVGCALLAACGNEDDGSNTAILTGAVAGKVGGQAWTVASAGVDMFMSDANSFWIDLYGESLDPCSMPIPTKNHIIVRAPKTAGDYALSATVRSTFVIEGTTTDNIIATRGRMIIEQVTDTQVSGGVYLESDANNSVNGKFTAQVCP